MHKFSATRLILSTRWIQVPFYVGLTVCQIGYAIRFCSEIFHFISDINFVDEKRLLTHVLGILDAVMVSNIISIVIIGGYSVFVSRLEISKNKLGWADSVQADMIKVKFALSLVGVSSVELLKSFVALQNMAEKEIFWQIVIHFVLVLSAIFVVMTIYIEDKSKLLHAPKQKDDAPHIG